MLESIASRATTDSNENNAAGTGNVSAGFEEPVHGIPGPIGVVRNGSSERGMAIRFRATAFSNSVLVQRSGIEKLRDLNIWSSN